MTTRTLRHGLLVLLLATIGTWALSQTVQIDAFDPTLREIEETQAELERTRRILADREERVALEQTLRYLRDQIRLLERDHDRVKSAEEEVERAREHLSRAESDLDAHFSGVNRVLRWLEEWRAVSRSPVQLLHLAIRDAANDLAVAEARHADALRSLERHAGPLRAEFGTDNLSELTYRRDELQTRIRDASITPDQAEQLRSDVSALSERLDRLYGERRDAAAEPAPPPPPDLDAAVREGETRIEEIATDIGVREALLQDPRVLNPEFFIHGHGQPVLSRTELRDALIRDLRAGVISGEQALAQARFIVEYDKHVRSLLRRELDSLRARRDQEQARHDALVTRLRQDAGSGVTHLLWVAQTWQTSANPAISADPAKYGGTVPYHYVRGIPDGTTITLTAPATHPGTPHPWDWTFIEWVGCDTASGTTCRVTMTGNKGVEVDYARGCYGGKRYWDTHCEGFIEPGAHRATLTAQNTIPGFAGSATYRCDRGPWVLESSTCTRTD